MGKNQNLNNRPSYVAKLPKTDHNLSHDFSFTASTGHLLPIDQQIMNVGERITYTPHIFARSNPLLSAAMADVDVYVDSFFVPMQMLFTAWDSVRWQTNDPLSSMWQEAFAGGNINLPLIDIAACLGYSGVETPDYSKYWGAYLTANAQMESSWSTLLRQSDFDCVTKEQFRLLNHFRLSVGDAFQGNLNAYYSEKNPRAFYAFLLAYQAIFENHYRLDDWEKKNVGSYNVDAGFLGDGNYIKSNCYILRMNYRPWHMDYFTSVKNNPISSFINMLGTFPANSGTNPLNELKQVSSFLSESASSQPFFERYDGYASNPNPLAIASVGFNNSTSNEFINTASIRSMFAVEKLNRIIGRSAKNYDAQVLAHFGFKVPHDVKHQITYLGTSKSLLHIGPVISTADTATEDGGAALGSVAGQGYIIMKGKRIKFTAPVDGVFMSIFSCVPRVRYTDTIDKQNYLTSRLSLFIPEFDKLGAEPLYSYEMNQTLIENYASQRLGWQYRYECFKRRPNTATLAFTIPFAPENPRTNMYSSWIVTRSPEDWNVNKYSYKYCPPTALNNCMVVKYDTAWAADYVTSPWLIYQQDPFIVDYHSECFLVSAMSAYGEPNIDGI